jgi:hypothetical protein
VRRSCAERLAGANALQVNQWPAALQRPRAAHRQLAGSNRDPQLGPSLEQLTQRQRDAVASALKQLLLRYERR